MGRHPLVAGLLAATLALSGCPEDGGAGPLGGGVGPIGEPDRPYSAAVVVEEAGIRATFEEAATVAVPVSATSASVGAEATVRVRFTPLGETEGPEGSATVTLTTTQQLVEVTITGYDPPEAQADLAGVVVRYEVSAGAAVASGARSLYHAVDKLGLQVWAPSSIDAGATTAVRAWARSLDSGQLLVGVPITLDGVTVQTDVAGQAAFDVTAPAEGPLELTLAATHGGLQVSATRTLQVVPPGSPRVFLSTDKPLYRPGQTMHLRALALAAADQAPIAGEPIALEVLDGKDNKIFREEGVTDAFGIASLTAPLAAQVNVGDYTIRAVLGDLIVERTVEVTEQKLPKFAVGVVFDSPWFAPGEAVTGVISARYFFGKAVVGADVTMQAGATAGHPAAIFSGQTDPEGLLAFALPDGAGSDLALAIEVVDTAGFSVATAATAKVATPELDVQLVPEATTVPEDSPWTLYVVTRGPLGGPAAATCTHMGALDLTVETGSGGVAAVEMPPGATAAFACTGEDGLSGSAYVSVETNYAGEAMLVHTDRAIYAPGELIEVTVLAPGAEDVVYIDRVHRGRIVESTVAAVTDGMATVLLSPSEEETGAVIVTGYFVREEIVVADDVAVFIQKPGAEVTVTTDQPTYLPGAEATLTFQVRNQQGEGVAGAIGVTIADEAVFALAGSASPDDVRGYFLLADEPQAVHPYAFGAPSEATQIAAAAALAVGGPASPVTASGVSLAVLQSQVHSVIAPWMYALRDSLQDDLQAAADAGGLPASGAASAVEGLDLYDYWGQPITISADANESYYATWLNVWLTSRGPDELEGSWDDWNLSLSVSLPHPEPPPGEPDDARPGAGGGYDGEGEWDASADEVRDALLLLETVVGVGKRLCFLPRQHSDTRAK